MKQAAAVAGAILALIGGTASAATGDYKGIYQFEFSGTVSGTDTYGAFGTKGAVFNNNTRFTETVALDFSKATEQVAPNFVDWTSNNARFMVSSITIGTVTYNFSQAGAQSAVLDSGNSDYAASDGHSKYIYLSDSQSATLHGVSGTAYTSQYLLGTPKDFGARFSASSATGVFVFDPSGCDPAEVLHLSDVVASAPEPGAWALMMLGVAGLGAALRFRRRQTAQIAAT